MLVHRVGREAAVLGTLGAEPRAPMAIVEALYTELDARLKKAAERTVLAHLMKLAAEGRAVRDGEGWRAA
jgi:Beta-lactamase associated winged helix domain